MDLREHLPFDVHENVAKVVCQTVVPPFLQHCL